MLVQQIYPNNQKLRSEIPLWLKFRCFEYQGFIGRQSGTFSGVLPTPPNQLGIIYVPAPPSLISGVSNKYKEVGAQQMFEALMTPASGLAKFLGKETFSKIMKAVGDLPDFLSSVASSTSYFTDIVPPDFNDNIYGGTNKRSYNFKLVLPCLTDEDSYASFAIARSFEALSVPSPSSVPFIFKHPPMWLFGVGPGTGPEIDFTWLTDPQLCNLASVAVNRSAPDNGSYAVLTDYGLKPSVTTISLTFIEIEPVYRDNLSLISRSQTLQNSGSALSSLFGGTP
jgi:hypothetical protein